MAANVLGGRAEVRGEGPGSPPAAETGGLKLDAESLCFHVRLLLSWRSVTPRPAVFPARGGGFFGRDTLIALFGGKSKPSKRTNFFSDFDKTPRAEKTLQLHA